MATIVKTQGGTWKAVIRKTGHPAVIKTWRLKRDAEDWARVTEDAIARGQYVFRPQAGRRMTVNDALDRYFKEIVPDKRPSTQQSDAKRAILIRQRLGQYAMDAVTREVLAGFRDQRLDDGCSNNTVRLDLALLSHLFSIAVKDWGTVPQNPVALIRRPSPGAGRNRRLVGDEEQRLLAACDAYSNPMFAAIVRLALFSAMRHGEIVSLTEGQVNLERRTITLPRTKNQSARTVPLSTAAVKVLVAALANPMRQGSSLIFPGEPGRRNGDHPGQRQPYSINRTWRATVKTAGLADFRFHDLRHEAVSRLVELGLSDQEVAAVSGHKSMQMLRRYTHLRAEDLVTKLG